MKTVIYADVLVAVNIYVTYFLIVAQRAFLKLQTKKYSVGIASVLGGISALTVLIDPITSGLNIIIKIVISFVITYIAFLPKTVKSFLKNEVVFLGVSLLFGGVMLFAENTIHPSGMTYINGTVYFDVSVKFLVICTLLCYGCVLVFDKIIKTRISKKVLFTAEIFFREKSIKTKAFYDTGNKCFDGVTGKLVIFAEKSAVKDLFNKQEIDYIDYFSLGKIAPDSLKRYVRVIPCGSVSGESILFGFIPEKIVIADGDKFVTTEKCVCAVTNRSLSDGEYSVILHSDIFERGI